MTDTPTERPYRTGRKPARHIPELAIDNFRSGVRANEGATSGDVTNGITAWGMLRNDQLGDCVPAATEHYRMAKGIFPGDAAPTDTETADLYFAYGVDQGEPGPQPDDGVEIATWLQWLFAQTEAAKLAGDDIVEYAFAEITNLAPSNLGVEMLEFRGVILGVNLTDDAQQLFPNSPWTVANGEQPDPNEGHGVLHAKFDNSAQLGTCVTWGALEGMTYPWMSACVEEAWVIVTREDAQNSGVDFDALVAAIKALGGDVGPTPAPLPEPTPSPSPSPEPVPSPTPVPTPEPVPTPTPEPPAPPSPTPEPSPSPSKLDKEIEDALAILATASEALPNGVGIIVHGLIEDVRNAFIEAVG